METVRVKPRLRGVLHQFASFIAAGAGLALVAASPTPRAAWAAGVYAFSLAMLLGVSALYHRPWWPLPVRKWLARVDHSAIFVLIAGTYTPLCLLALSREAGSRLLWWAWAGALLGILRVLFWPKAPRAIRAGSYLVLGWLAVVYAKEFHGALSPAEQVALIAGGLIYTAGAFVYVLRRPNPAPRVFGYHEVFHAMVLLAAACHFACITTLVRTSGEERVARLAEGEDKVLVQREGRAPPLPREAHEPVLHR